MALTKKFKSLIGLQNEARSPLADDLTTHSIAGDLTLAKFKEHITEHQKINPQIDKEIIVQIEPVYFREPEFDITRHELEKLPEAVDLSQINNDRYKLTRQLQSVSKKVSELVLENHPAYAAELQRVMNLQESLQMAEIICANSRRRLLAARVDFTTASLGLLKNYRKRQQLYALLKSLRTIKTLQRTDIRLREMMEEEDYSGAIQLCLECQKAASTLKHYKCISELSSKLQDTLEMIEEQLDVALSKTCNNFDTHHYEKVQTAYCLLGKTQTAMDQLHMHFTSAIHNTAFNIVLGYVELCSGTGDSSFQKRHYSDLCTHIVPEVFAPCLTDLCKALWEVMKSYYHTMKWHETCHMAADEREESLADGSSGNTEISQNRRYVQRKLEHGLARIWQDVQLKVRHYILSTDLAYFKFDEFIKVLNVVTRMVEIGEEFCGSQSESLQESIRKQSLSYFHNYHRSRVDELRMFLENEGWELCPVKKTFGSLQLQEFRFLREQLEMGTESPMLNHKPDLEKSERVKYFQQYLNGGNPFAIRLDEEENEDVMEINGEANFNESGSESDSENYAVRETRSSRSSEKLNTDTPLITNTTLTVLRLFGKYMQMMNVLKPIAFDVLICMTQLFDYYIYAVYSFFALDQTEQTEASMSNQLLTTLKRIRSSLILEETIPGCEANIDEVRDKVAHPHLSPTVDLNSSAVLYGLAERVVAVESLVFLSDQFQILQPYLEAMISPLKKAFLQQYNSQTVSVTPELRHPIYRVVASWTNEYSQVMQYMAVVKWDIHEIMSQHNSYVEVALQELNTFGQKLCEISTRVPIHKVVSDVLWEHIIVHVIRNFVEGYSGAKKCTTEGRAWMQLDFQQFLMKLETITEIRPIPDREYVEAYIKAYYLPETQIESWVKEHKEYTSKQLTALVNSMSHISRKGRQRALSCLEENEQRPKWLPSV
ncbi:syndetin-like isoform X2 [Tubulanus polymorphus]|uniref:syndetin-like isoform X2 n=1 Tax=Tubulanus polymorphus TaxID=672921 RepID=UPI003DA2DB81